MKREQGTPLSLDSQITALDKRKTTTTRARQAGEAIARIDGDAGTLGQALRLLAERVEQTNQQLSGLFDEHHHAINSKDEIDLDEMANQLVDPRARLSREHDDAGRIMTSAMIRTDPKNQRALDTIRDQSEALQDQTQDLSRGLLNYGQQLALTTPADIARMRYVEVPEGFYPHTSSIDEMPVWPNAGRMKLDENGRPILEPLTTERRGKIAQLAHQMNLDMDPNAPSKRPSISR